MPGRPGRSQASAPPSGGRRANLQPWAQALGALTGASDVQGLDQASAAQSAAVPDLSGAGADTFGNIQALPLSKQDPFANLKVKNSFLDTITGGRGQAAIQQARMHALQSQQQLQNELAKAQQEAVFNARIKQQAEDMQLRGKQISAGETGQQWFNDQNLRLMQAGQQPMERPSWSTQGLGRQMLGMKDVEEWQKGLLGAGESNEKLRALQANQGVVGNEYLSNLRSKDLQNLTAGQTAADKFRAMQQFPDWATMELGAARQKNLFEGTQFGQKAGTIQANPNLTGDEMIADVAKKRAEARISEKESNLPVIKQAGGQGGFVYDITDPALSRAGLGTIFPGTQQSKIVPDFQSLPGITNLIEKGFNLQGPQAPRVTTGATLGQQIGQQPTVSPPLAPTAPKGDGQISVISPTGIPGRIPAEDLPEALKQGYKRQ